MNQIDDWDNGNLGRDEAFVERAPAEVDSNVDEAMRLKMISIRLSDTLIDDLKFIATAHGIGYQPLMRDVLERFVTHEKKEIIQGVRSAVKRKVGTGSVPHRRRVA